MLMEHAQNSFQRDESIIEMFETGFIQLGSIRHFSVSFSHCELVKE